jgi:ASPIC and UnbV/FG-GAP-like repeat
MKKPGFIFLFLLVVGLISCSRKHPLFREISSDQSGVHFNNLITENDSLNPADNVNVYNGGGVGIGDFNRDGLPDIYFTGNMVSNKLYLNKGQFKFEDITEQAGVAGEGRWCKGVSVIDINNDGWPDIYISTSIYSDPNRRKNLLYINQGNDAQGIPHFKEMAAEYGLADTTHSTMAAFFDYDNDGDLDVFITVNQNNKLVNPNFFKPVINDGSAPSTGRLYRNDWSDSLHHPVFTDVTKKANLLQEGYGHGVTIVDVNLDGWKDIYLTNDFLTQDILYINQHDGTFKNESKTYFKHTATSAMGNDAEDINNDGLVDLFELDMDPEDNYRKKTMMGGNNYLTYQLSDQFGYQYQYSRNNLQLNRGPRLNPGDSIGAPVFSDIGFYAGVFQTDWSWTPMIVDFDNDGWRDILITNGYPKDVTDHDFMAFRDKSLNLISKTDLIKEIPEVKLNSYAYKNNGDLTFTDVSSTWGFNTYGFSNGAVYADLDNDGDLDVVVNKVNGEAGIFQNMSSEDKTDNAHFLNISFRGDSLNKAGLGAFAEIYYDGNKMQVYENTPYRGYLSTIQDIAHFGLGKSKQVDSLIVKWPNGKKQTIINVAADQHLTVNIHDAAKPFQFNQSVIDSTSLFTDFTRESGVHYLHEERDYIDFNVQKLLPHKLSEYGPAIAVGDIDHNGMDDFITGGAAFHSAQIFLQQANGTFIQKPLVASRDSAEKLADDESLLLFDADGDGDLDLYVAMGGYEALRNTPAYQDRLYINDGKGNFKLDEDALPKNWSSKLCVRAADYDRDGDLDLFISGRVDPQNYPKPVNSYVYRNDSKGGKVHFTDVTSAVAKDLQQIGLVCDAVFTDFNNDGWPDLVLAGEWMPVTFLENEKGVFKNVTPGTGLDQVKGWWNSIAAGDFDNDGDIDYVVGNLGLNSFFKANDQFPVRAYAKDFDKNGIYDLITSVYLKDKDGKMQEFPADSRDDLLKQVNAFRRLFPTYKDFAVATMNDVLSKQDRDSALILEANEFRTCILRNDGNGKFSLHPLPAAVQFSLVNGMTVDDFDDDGNLDVLITGNDYGTAPVNGRYDAFDGLFLKGDGMGGFKPQTILQSGIFIPGNGKALAEIRGVNGKTVIAATQNRGFIKLFSLRKSAPLVSVHAGETDFMMTLRNGKKRKQEIYYGSSFLSQSGRYVKKTAAVTAIEKRDPDGKWIPFEFVQPEK